MESSIQSYPWYLISLDGTILLNNMTDTEFNILNLVIKIKKCLVYDTIRAF